MLFRSKLFFLRFNRGKGWPDVARAVIWFAIGCCLLAGALEGWTWISGRAARLIGGFAIAAGTLGAALNLLIMIREAPSDARCPASTARNSFNPHTPRSGSLQSNSIRNGSGVLCSPSPDAPPPEPLQIESLGLSAECLHRLARGIDTATSVAVSYSCRSDAATQSQRRIARPP